jgi:quinol monooxygenase YgiN
MTVPGADREDMMQPIHIIATFTAIPPDQLDTFKATVTEATGLASHEDGTLEYAWFLDAGETRCLMIEKYASPHALMVHMGNVGHLLGPLFGAGGPVEVSILGPAPDTLIEATRPFDPTMYSQFASAR